MNIGTITVLENSTITHQFSIFKNFLLSQKTDKTDFFIIALGITIPQKIQYIALANKYPSYLPKKGPPLHSGTAGVQREPTYKLLIRHRIH